MHSATETQVEAPPLPSPSTLSPSISLSNMSNTQTCLTCHMSNTLPSPSTLSPSISLCLGKLPKLIIDLQLLDPASPADQLLSQILFNCNRKLWKPQLQYGGSAWCPRWSICSRNIAMFGIYYHIMLFFMIWSI